MRNTKGRTFTPMSTNQWIIGELERMLAELRKPQAPSNAGGGGTPAPAAGGGATLGAWKRAKVTFWGVEEKQGPKGPYTRAALYVSWVENGERMSAKMSTLDRKLIEAIDPLEKGASIEYQSEKNGQYENVIAVRPARG